MGKDWRESQDNEILFHVKLAKEAKNIVRPKDNLTKHVACTALLPYLIFVIFFTQAKFLENKIYTEIYTVNCQFFALNLKKIYTGQKKITRTPSVASVTNIRYDNT